MSIGICTSVLRKVRIIVVDLDRALIHKRHLSVAIYQILERLQAAGIKVIGATQVSAGWCEALAATWPFEGIVGENGAFFFTRSHTTDGLTRIFWHEAQERSAIRRNLLEVGEAIAQGVPGAGLGEDQHFRLASLSLRLPFDDTAKEKVVRRLWAEGANAALCGSHIIGWPHEYDRRAMIGHVLATCYGTGIEDQLETALYAAPGRDPALPPALRRRTLGRPIACGEAGGTVDFTAISETILSFHDRQADAIGSE